MAIGKGSSNRNNFEKEFLRTVLADSTMALARFEQSDKDDPRIRRELVRTIHATIEGVAWAYREHVRFAAKSLGVLSIEEEAALSEVTYQVTHQGKVVAQPRHLSIVNAFRLTSRIAAKLSPELNTPFDNAEWDRFRRAIETRNRLTHPKTELDLAVSAAQVADSVAAFFWMLEISVRSMEESNAVMASFIGEFKSVLSKLQAGDPEILAAYHKAKFVRDE